MIFKKMVSVYIISFINFFVLNNCNYENNKALVLGNWKSIESNAGQKIHFELFIDEETINIFSEEVNEIIFSNYYSINGDEIIILEDNKEIVALKLKYRVSNNSLVLLSDKYNSKYIRVKSGKTLEDYINGKISRDEYIQNFGERSDTQ